MLVSFYLFLKISFALYEALEPFEAEAYVKGQFIQIGGEDNG